MMAGILRRSPILPPHQVKDIGDRATFELYLQGFPVESTPVAHVTRAHNIRQELHFDAHLSLPLACFTASSVNIERETARL
jgi:hypothetical protein